MYRTNRLLAVSVLVLAVMIGLLVANPFSSDSPGSDDTLVFFCAAGMKPPVTEIIQQYEEDYGVEVQVDFGGSGTLLGKLSVSSIGDLYLAADQTYIDMAKEKFIVKETLPVSHIQPVIIVPKGNPKSITSIADLARDDVRLCLANPDAASIGRTVRELLESSGEWKQVEPTVDVYKPTVNDVANDVKLGAVDAGIVWDAVAAQYPDLEAISTPSLETGTMQVTLGVLTGSKAPARALHFARYLTSEDKGLPVFRKHGYDIVKGDPWAEKPTITLFSGTVNRPAIDETILAFQEREGAEINISYAGCGVLVGQMKAGERPDAYFACDISFMYQVNDLFLDAHSLAETDIVIVVKKGNPLGIQSVNDLTREGVRVGVCNPEISALGALTNRLLTHLGVVDDVMANVVSQVPTGDFLINQINTGSLDAAIVYDANTARVRDSLDRVRIDHEAAKAVQPFAVAKNSRYPQLTRRLLEAIRTAESQKMFEANGFTWLDRAS